MQTNLRIKSISNEDGKSTVTDNITYVNPNLSDANAKLLAMKINALTKNAYDTTERIDTRDLDTDSKTDRTLTLTLGGTYTFDLTQDSIDIPLSAIDSTNKTLSGSLTVPANDTSKLITSDLNNLSFQWSQITYRVDTTTTNTFSWRFIFSQSDTPFSASVKFFLPNNNLYNAWEKLITINFVSGGE